MNDRLTILHGDCREVLKTLPDCSVQCCVTSPPYWGLRSYLRKDDPMKAREIGSEKTPQEYVQTMVEVFREVRRVLKDNGTLWLNLGDSFFGSWGNFGGKNRGNGKQREIKNGSQCKQESYDDLSDWRPPTAGKVDGLKPKDLVGIPWRVAFALQADGWWLRSDIVWFKRNCMPESVSDRCTRSHEYIFHLTKSARYYYDHEAIKEPCVYDVDGTGTAARKARAKEGDKEFPTSERNGMRNGGYKNNVNFDGKNKGNEKQRGHSRRHDGFNERWDKMEKEEQCTGMRNKRDVWEVSPSSYKEAHFATFPPDLIKPCILAGSKPGDTILDPFAGSGTSMMVAIEYGRKALGIELNAEYLKFIENRVSITPGLGI